jgi:short subunit dehydrogenase-like uncharacterized protein
MKFDLILFGATGFTGRLVLEHLRDHAPAGFRYAVLGRNQKKLEQVLASANVTVPILVADASDAVALKSVVAQTRVVATTVGPYARHGLPLVAACAEAGVHYCDITGEVNFMRKSIDANAKSALDSTSCIVHACGFDSIPSDLGVLTLANLAQNRFGKKLGKVRSNFRRMKGGVSGGTLLSGLSLMEAARSDSELRRLLGDPYSLSPKRDEEPNVDQRDQMYMKWDPKLHSFAMPFVMGSVNSRVVRRSNALAGHAYGRSFTYEEVQSFGKGAKGFLRGAVTAGTIGSVFGLARVKRLRPLLDRVLPSPGEGPSPELQKTGFFELRIEGQTEDGNEQVAVEVNGKGDPGYAATSRMLAQTAIALAAGEALRFGVLTPATALGAPLAERLRAHGITFDAA